jgi:hypothetical protein
LDTKSYNSSSYKKKKKGGKERGKSCYAAKGRKDRVGESYCMKEGRVE